MTPLAAVAAVEAGRLPGRTALVFAHPDDETAAVGGIMDRFETLGLTVVTDGAPYDMGDALRAGFASREAYAEARAAELEAALAALGVQPDRRALELVDQTAVEHLAALTRTAVEMLEGCAVVITHPYEGGHPDHNACAFAVQNACRLMQRAPVRLEAPFYRARGGERVVGEFQAHPACPETTFTLSPERLAAKRAALAVYRSQAAVLSWFDPAMERLRPAPDYDFIRPSGETALYDAWGWALTSAAWRGKAAAALVELGLAA
ncbi:MAG: PIG-L family deacetylase [Proteobacteria bacterium]|nr:PIG-L family deacetylase [Pseudomonadota bacterium]